MARSESFLDERRERLAAPGVTVNGIAGIEVDAADMTRLALTAGSASLEAHLAGTAVDAGSRP